MASGSAPTLTSESPQGIQATTMRHHNIAGILKVVLMRGPVARAEITRATNTSSGAITKLTSALLKAGVIREYASMDSAPGPGRPRVPLDLDTSSRAVLSLHIGVNLSTIAAVDLRGGVVIERLVKHRSTSIDNVIDALIGELSAMRGELRARRVVGVGVTSAGVIDVGSGVLVSHPHREWAAAAVRDRMASRLDLPVVYDNEVRAEAMAELMYGTRLTVSNLITLFVGGVVEAGLVVNRQIQRGTHGNAGSLAHLPIGSVVGAACRCGSRSCFGTVATNPALLAMGRERGVVEERETYDDVLARANDGDVEARRLLDQRARWVGEAVGVVQDLFDPEAVVLSGNATYFDGYLDAVRASAGAVDPSRSGSTVRLASFGAHSTAVSSAALFLDRYFADPVAFEPELRHVG